MYRTSLDGYPAALGPARTTSFNSASSSVAQHQHSLQVCPTSNSTVVKRVRGMALVWRSDTSSAWLAGAGLVVVLVLLLAGACQDHQLQLCQQQCGAAPAQPAGVFYIH